MAELSHAYVCIMAGGSGERFWPMSRQRTPKHLLKLFSERTLIGETVRRVEGVVPRQNIVVLANAAQLEATRAALPDLGPEQIIAEPAKRDTAPAAALATAVVRARDEAAVLALLPADALIEDTATFAWQLRQAFARAGQPDSVMVTFAIEPTHPATGFGYLEMEPAQEGGFRRVARFVEKPDAATARRYVADGRHAWNAGMFIWRVSTFLTEAERQAPALAKFIREFPPGDVGAYLTERFPALPKISVDYAIMEHAASVVTLVADFDWDDVGAWTALPAHLPQDEAGNTLRGPVVAQAATRNIAVSNGRVIALCGVKDLVVVETPDAVLVCHRDAVQQIKQLMPDLPPGVI